MSNSQRTIASIDGRARDPRADHAMRIREMIARHVDPAESGLASVGTTPGERSRLDDIELTFGLSRFERDLLAWSAALEMDGDLADATFDMAGTTRPSFRAALQCLEGANWQSTSPSAPLRRWSLVASAGGGPAMEAPLVVDEAVFGYLVGLQFEDRALEASVTWKGRDVLLPSHQAFAERLAAGMSAGASGSLLLRMAGAAGASAAVAVEALGQVGYSAAELNAADLPSVGRELVDFCTRWSRQAALSRAGLILRIADDLDSASARAVGRMLPMIWGPVIVVGEGEPDGMQGMPTFALPSIGREERVEALQVALGDAAERLNGQIQRTATHFEVDGTDLSTIATAYRIAAGDSDDADLWSVARRHARPALGSLAQRIQTRAGWSDIVLPAAQMRMLREIATHVRHHHTVCNEWGFGKLNGRGLGVSALFHGPSGTGKTLAAEVLANELDMDVYRIDLAAVVSKFIGETEKNLARVFDAASRAPVVLLFDEADALFGKRSEVRDSHDRYANLEVSYLLQRVETFRGLAILTTNNRSALDHAFLRRIRFVIGFPFPDQEQRAEIWKRVFPSATPLENVDAARLARLNVAGGHIRNMAMDAAFRAAEAGTSVTMHHLQHAARAEYEKMERPLSEKEFKWLT